MHYGRSKAQRLAFEASTHQACPLGQKVLLTVLFACTGGRDRPIRETNAELAALCGIEMAEYFDHLRALRAARIITDDSESRGLRINRRAIKNAKAIDERAAMAAKRVRSRLSKLP
jgi:hypothetical protein